MQFSADEWQKMQAVYEEHRMQIQSPIQIIRKLRAKFDLRLADAKHVFDKLHYRDNYEERQKEIEQMIDIAIQVFAAESELRLTSPILE